MTIQNLHQNNFTFSFDRFNLSIFKMRNCTLPSLSVGSIPLSASVLDFPIPGDKLTYGTLSVDFIVDADLANYLQVFNYMRTMGSEDRDALPRPEPKDLLSDATLTVLSNHKNPVAHFDFKDCYIQSLSDLVFDYSTGDTDVVTCQIAIEYSYYIQRL